MRADGDKANSGRTEVSNLVYRHKKHNHGLALARVDMSAHVAIFYSESRSDVELVL